MYECIIFDVDGTLIDSEEAVLNSLKIVLKEELGRSFSSEELSFAFGIPGDEPLRKLGIKDIDDVIYRWDKYLKKFHHLIKVYPQIENVLKILKDKGVRIGIVTSKTKREYNEDFIPYGLGKYIDNVVCADDTLKHKPYPDPINKFLEISGAKKHTSIYIGDTAYDSKCAHSAGVDFALAGWGAKNPEDIPAKFKLKSPEDILSIVL